MWRLTIPTADRPEILPRCIEILLRAPEIWDTFEYLLISDDSRNPEATHKNRELIQSLFEATGKPLMFDRVLNRPSPHGMSQGLPASLTSLGANRNTALLYTAGAWLLFMDDDAQFAFSCYNGKPEHSEDEPFLAATFSSKEALTSRLHPVHAGEITEFLQTIASPSGGIATTSDASGGQKESGTVRAVMLGVMGNRWFGLPSAFLRFPSRVTMPWYKTKKEYHAARTSRFALLQSVTYHENTSPFLIGGMFGLDARQLPPPFPPLGRPEVAVLAMLMKLIYPDNLVAHLPYCIHHDLGPPRPVTEAEFHDTTPTFGILTRLVVQHLGGHLAARHDYAAEDCSEAAAARRLVEFGGELQKLAVLPQHEWQQLSHELLIQEATRESAHLEILLERFNGEPSYWARDVQGHIERLVEQSALPENATPRELRTPAYSPDEAGRIHQEFCRSYGELMLNWPQIWQEARERNRE